MFSVWFLHLNQTVVLCISTLVGIELGTVRNLCMVFFLPEHTHSTSPNTHTHILKFWTSDFWELPASSCQPLREPLPIMSVPCSGEAVPSRSRHQRLYPLLEECQHWPCSLVKIHLPCSMCLR